MNIRPVVTVFKSLQSCKNTLKIHLVLFVILSLKIKMLPILLPKYCEFSLPIDFLNHINSLVALIKMININMYSKQLWRAKLQ